MEPSSVTGRGRDLAGAAVDTRERAFVYRMLALVLGDRPNAATVRALRAPEVADTFAAFGYDLGVGAWPADDDAAAVDLTTEYTRLFVGPRDHVPPFQSVQEASDGRGALWGASTQQMRRRLAAWGLAPRAAGKVPDHVAVEIDFMVHLVAVEDDAHARGDTARAAMCRRAQRVVLEEHLLAWLPRFADRVEARARVPLYHEMIRFAVDYMRQDRDHLESAREDGAT